MSGELDGKVALITGSGRGMGYVDAQLMAREGAAIVVHDIDPVLADEATKELRHGGADVMTIVCDVADVEAMHSNIAEAETRFGRIDILVNNAGNALGGALEEIDEHAYDAVMNVHVKGSFFATQAVVPGMKQRGEGVIINISSIWGMTGYEHSSNYCAAKAALLGLTKAWAKELAPWNIRVNAVAPGCVLTEMTVHKGKDYIDERAKLIPLGRWAQPEEMSNAVAFLASPRASYITGQTISPNGGDTIVGI